MTIDPLRPLTPRTKLSRTAREVVRQGLYQLGIQRSAGYLAPDTIGERFTTIYSQGVWKVGDPSNPGSGAGQPCP